MHNLVRRSLKDLTGPALTGQWGSGQNRALWEKHDMLKNCPGTTELWVMKAGRQRAYMAAGIRVPF